MRFEDWFALIGIAYLAVVAVPLSVIDLREHRLPNRLVLPALPIAFTGQALTSFLSSEWARFAAAWIAGAIAFTAGLVANRLASLGMGDVKLIAVISVSLGWISPLLPIGAFFLALLAATLVILPKLLLRRLRLSGSVPLGPYLLVGAFGSLGFSPFI